jgi:hypothetical protein
MATINWRNVTLCLLTATTAVASAQAAPMLQGYVKSDKQIEGQTPVSCAVSTPAPEVVSPLDNSFPPSYAGHWRCLSQVVDSSVDSVPVGDKNISEIIFARLNDGRVAAKWNQPGWTETKASISSFNNKEAKLDRTNYYFGNRQAGAWAARSCDHFTMVSPTQIIADSYIDQYQDGTYLGRYRTQSILVKVSESGPADGIAFGANF